MQRFALLSALMLASCTAVEEREEPAAVLVPIEPSRDGFGFDVVALHYGAANEIAHLVSRLQLSVPPTMVLADQRTNSVVINGPDEGRKAARELIAKLDVEAK